MVTWEQLWKSRGEKKNLKKNKIVQEIGILLYIEEPKAEDLHEWFQLLKAAISASDESEELCIILNSSNFRFR